MEKETQVSLNDRLQSFLREMQWQAICYLGKTGAGTAFLSSLLLLPALTYLLEHTSSVHCCSSGFFLCFTLSTRLSLFIFVKFYVKSLLPGLV